MAKKNQEAISLDDGSALTPPDAPQTTETNEREAPKIERLENYLFSKYDFYRDSIQEEIYYKHKFEPEFEKLNEDSIRYELLKANFSRFDAELKAIFKGPVMDERNEIEETFNSLPPWNGEDYFSKLVDCIRLTQETTQERNRLHTQLKKHLVRSIACALEPRFTNRFMFVLYSEAQHVGKSQLIRWLTPEPMRKDYYYEVTAFNGADKDFLSQLRYCYFMNFDEMSGLDRNDQNQVKAIISQETVRLRLPYASKVESRPRIVTLWGTTNKREFLLDETGSTRYLIFDIANIDWHTYTRSIDINNLWAQMYHLYKTNPDLLKVSQQELKENEISNSLYKLQTDEANFILKFIHLPPYEQGEAVEELTSTEILQEIQKRIITSNRLSSINVGKALKQMGFHQVNSYANDLGYSIKKWIVKFKYQEKEETKNPYSA